MLTKNNTLIIVPPAGTYPIKMQASMSALGYEVCTSMKGKSNYFCRGYRSLTMKYDLSIKKVLFGDWYKINLSQYENILIFHDKYSFSIVKTIQEKLRFSGKIYLYYMDPISTYGAKDCNSIRVDCSEKFSIYSFEKKDCDLYGFKYNSLFFFKEDAKEVNEYWTDAFFIGTDKGRLEEILEIKKILCDEGLNVNVHVCKYRNKPSPYGKKIHYAYKQFLPYEELMQNLYHTKCVLDIVPKGQEEVTLRVYEALFCKKKVITNNVNIKKYEFYNPKNIFIIGENSIRDVKEFVFSEFDTVHNEAILNMDFTRWIKRFV